MAYRVGIADLLTKSDDGQWVEEEYRIADYDTHFRAVTGCEKSATEVVTEVMRLLRESGEIRPRGTIDSETHGSDLA